jgi:E3 ubiquitin-protein ligase BAH
MKPGNYVPEADAYPKFGFCAKIIPEFDKRTALGIKSTFTNRLPPSMSSEDIAKGLSAQMATDILSVIPQLDDFLCPICSELAWRPIRLRCQHIYCIRCLIRLQQERKDRCPLCRQDVVMEADSCKYYYHSGTHISLRIDIN